MSAFKLPVDIANAACQQLGAQRILTTDFSENSQQATELGACYDQLRESELRRNLWVFATRRCILRPVDISSTLWTPAAYAAGTTYSVGDVATDTAGEWWQSKRAGNVGNAQTEGSAYWSHYNGSDAPVLFDTTLTTTYFTGEIVLLPAAWSGATTYAQYDVAIVSNGTYYDTYVSLQGSNLNHAPASSPTYWQLLATFLATSPTPTNPLTYPSGYTVYMAMGNGLGGVASTAPGNGNWKVMGGTVLPLQILYPIGTGPSVDARTGNVFRLPHGYLRWAPSNPKAGTNVYLGAPHLEYQQDALYENEYVVSAMTGPRMLRYVANFVDVPDMDPMFCEGLGKRMALETCDRITGSNADRADAIRAYKQVMGDAREANGIELGQVAIAEDEYIACWR